MISILDSVPTEVTSESIRSVEDTIKILLLCSRGRNMLEERSRNGGKSLQMVLSPSPQGLHLLLVDKLFIALTRVAVRALVVAVELDQNDKNIHHHSIPIGRDKMIGGIADGSR